MVSTLDAVTRPLFQGGSVYKDTRPLHISSTLLLYPEFYVEIITWSLATLNENNWRIFVKKMLTRMFGPNRWEVTVRG